jgi:hypothetical protein
VKSTSEDIIGGYIAAQGGIFASESITIKDAVTNISLDVISGGFIETTNGKITLDNAKVNVPSYSAKKQLTHGIWSGGELEIINESDIDINFTSEEEEYDSSNYCYKYGSEIIYSTENMSIRNSYIEIIADIYEGYAISNTDGTIDIEETAIVINAIGDNVFGIGTFLDKGNCNTGNYISTISDSNITFTAKPKTTVESGKYKYSSVVYAEMDKISITDTDIDALSDCGIVVDNETCRRDNDEKEK